MRKIQYGRHPEKRMPDYSFTDRPSKQTYVRALLGVDNIPAELVQAGGEDVITVLTAICDKIWQTGEWPTPWTQSLVIILPKKGKLQQCQYFRTISHISHPSKVMLKLILNRLKPQAEKIIAEE